MADKGVQAEAADNHYGVRLRLAYFFRCVKGQRGWRDSVGSYSGGKNITAPHRQSGK